MAFDPADLPRIAALAATRRPWHSMPQAFYRDPAIHAVDLEAIFARHWIMIGFECELAETGSYLAQTIGETPVIVTRDRNGVIAAFHNACRHRGAQICPDGSGKAPRLVCPYHQWSYALDGRLLAARQMGPEFEASRHGLIPIRVECVAGCVYVCLSDDAPDFAPFRAALEPQLLPHNLKDGKVAHVEIYDEKANWKLVMENGRECYHCAARHPELIHAFAAEIGNGPEYYDEQAETSFMANMREAGLDQPYQESDWWQVGRLPMLPGVKSYSLDGGPLVKKRLTDLADGEVGSLRWAVEPHNFCHASADCAVMVSAYPTGPETSVVEAKFLVHKDAVEGVDYDRETLIHVWDQTNRQDRDLAENNQRGVNGKGYVPGPYSPVAEPYVNSFVTWYLDRLTAFCQSG